MNSNIPCFFHIPRSGGTYLLYKSSDFLRLYGLKMGWNNRINWNLDIRLIFVTLDNKIIFTAIAYDKLQNYKNNKNFKSIYGEYSDIVEYENFITACKQNGLLLSSIAIESDGAHLIPSGFFKKFLNELGLNPIYYATLREPFDRAVSLYYYINSPASVHEPTHNKIKSKSVEEYLSSYDLEDSWVIRTFTGIPNNKEIHEEDFKKASEILSQFTVKDISKIDELIHEIFSKRFHDSSDLLQHLKTKKDFYKNKSEKKQCLRFSDLKEETRSFFLKRKKYDIELYNKFAISN